LCVITREQLDVKAQPADINVPLDRMIAEPTVTTGHCVTLAVLQLLIGMSNALIVPVTRSDGRR
jgi:hypothetical protein